VGRVLFDVSLKMQPVYQIPGVFLEAHIASLSKIPEVESCDSNLHSLLFLSGLKRSVNYFQAARDERDSFKNWFPMHHIDDGLSLADRDCFITLMRIARSKPVRDMIKAIYPEGAPNHNWLAINFAFAEVFQCCNEKVLKWISNGDPKHNKLRLSCAMGIISPWASQGIGFILEIPRKPLSFNINILTALQSFVLTSDNSLPELP